MTGQHLCAAVVGVVFLLGIGGTGFAKSMVFPSKGQSKEQQEQDEFSCYKWAVEQTGVDPRQASSPTAQPQQEAALGGAARGAGKGAALGAIGGAIGGDAGKGAKIGAAVGGAGGAMGSRKRNRQREAAAQQQAQQKQNAMAEYDKAWGLCMKGKGYEVG